MLITAQNLPMDEQNGDGIPWFTIILTMVLVAGISYLSYQSLKPAPALNASKTDENEKGQLG